MASLTTGGTTTTGTFTSTDETTLFQVGTSRNITLAATSVNLALTSTCQFVSLIAQGGTHCHFQIGIGTQTATASSHYLLTGERIFLAVPFGANIAAIRGTGAATTLYITELEQ
jgi:hypothetical protein